MTIGEEYVFVCESCLKIRKPESIWKAKNSIKTSKTLQISPQVSKTKRSATLKPDFVPRRAIRRFWGQNQAPKSGYYAPMVLTELALSVIKSFSDLIRTGNRWAVTEHSFISKILQLSNCSSINGNLFAFFLLI